MHGRSAERVGAIAFQAAVVFLAFVGGTLAAVTHLFPSGYVENAYTAGRALYEKSFSYVDPYRTDLWTKADRGGDGVVVPAASGGNGDLILYTSGDGPDAVLIDRNGRPVHRWHRPYSSVWDASAAVSDPVPDRQIYFRKAHAFPDGDLLALYESVGDTPYGYGLVRLDRRSRIVWKNLDHFHHDFDLAPDGRVFALTHAFRDTFPNGLDHFQLPFLEDSLAVLSPDGRTVKKISLPDAIDRSGYRRLLWRIPYYSLEDPLHANSVEYIDARKAARLKPKVPQVREGQVLVSFRELAGGTVALLDPDDGRLVWALRGPWSAQHDPDVLDNGDLLVFDNRGHFGPGGQSRIVEVDPSNGREVWHYAGSAAAPFESLIRGSQQRLPNGNTLITESGAGRLLEVAPGGRTVWAYDNPVRGGPDNAFRAIVCWGERYAPDYFAAGFLSPRTSTQQEASNA